MLPSSVDICSRSGKISIYKSRPLNGALTSFQRCLGTFSTSMTGSINVVLPRDTSGIQIAHSKWDHLNVFVCLKAPSIFGQKMHVWRKVSKLPYVEQPGRTYRCIATDQLALPAKPLTLRDERYPIALLVNSQVTSVAEYNCIRILAVTIIANSAFCVLFFSCYCSFPVYGG
jgi:hypothetical protein